MILTIDNARTHVAGDYDELKWIESFLSYEKKRFDPALGYQRELTLSLFEFGSQTFPTGWAGVIARRARAEGLAVTMRDARKRPCDADESADTAWLRDYQQAALASLVKRQRGIIKIPTGGGKTEVFVAATRALPCEWLFAVGSVDLAEQAAERFSLRTGERAGSFANGEWRRGTANVTVSTFQSLYAALKRRAPGFFELAGAAEALCVDEAHTLSADTFYAVVGAMGAAYWRIGLSGTPLMRDEEARLRLCGAIGPQIFEAQTQKLIADGILARPRVRMVPVDQAAQFEHWATAYSQLIVGSTKRNAALREIACAARKPAMLFVEQVKHGTALLKLLRCAGLQVDFAHDKAGDRAGKLKRLASGQLDVLITTAIFQTGIDVPELASVICGGGKASAVATLQRLGRGMRCSASSGTEFEAWDISDSGNKWLHSHAVDRWQAYASEGHEVKIALLESLTPQKSSPRRPKSAGASTRC